MDGELLNGLLPVSVIVCYNAELLFDHSCEAFFMFMSSSISGPALQTPVSHQKSRVSAGGAQHNNTHTHTHTNDERPDEALCW